MSAAVSVVIVSGPTCVGKSTLIEGGYLSKLNVSSGNSTTVYAFQLTSGKFDIIDNSIVHYNILRPISLIGYDFAIRWGRLLRALDVVSGRYVHAKPIRHAIVAMKSRIRAHCWAKLKPQWNYLSDKSWSQILRLKVKKTVLVLGAREADLKERAKSRTVVEKGFASRYDRLKWLCVYECINLMEVYRIWCNEIERAGLQREFIVSHEGEFRIVTTGEEFFSQIGH